MMNMTVSEGSARWGEARVAERAARKTRRRIALIVMAILLVVGLPFLEGFIDGFLHRPRASLPHPLAQLAAVIMLIVVGVMTWRNWRETDEMQRRLAIETWAVIGVTNFVLHPLLTIVGAQTDRVDFGDYSWGVSVMIGLTFYVLRRVRS
ncbi:hypothetical protein [Sphingomonas yabuuchiae]|uniref:Type IV secretory pathway VirB2 component (Pilin) n=1 Tax=Sphingomonas yabuuchiae TaxID=172044 RepID=A0AA41A3W2_9SPHN|nr:hypothetical protein [Sphingomonas yabuuchiae]MBB4610336.1 type IV secretory pathway VirB2 component (pilin) [Sphingomonas yabuuchiae]MBN3560371.1 hypothetical protein [Sphingomonas yabuuchiae]